MRRLVIVRNDLIGEKEPEKTVCICAERYWQAVLKESEVSRNTSVLDFSITIGSEALKAALGCPEILFAANRGQLLEIEECAVRFGLKEGRDFGIISDESGTPSGAWTAPLDDEVAEAVSRKYE